MVGPVPPQIPNRYDNDERRLRRIEEQEMGSRRRAIALVVVGLVLIGATLILARIGWAGGGLILVPIALGLIVGGGIQLVTGGYD